MGVDAHQHFWVYRRDRYPWITESMGVLQQDFRPGDLAGHLQAAGLDGSVAVQASVTSEETEWLLQLATRHPEVKGVVGWVDLRADTAGVALERLAAHPHFCGVRHPVQDEPDERFLLREDFLRGVALLKEFDLTYDILVFPQQLPAAIEFVRRLAGQRLVLDHLGKPPIRDGTMEPWASQVRELGQYDHVWCKVSGMVTEAAWTSWTPDALTPYLDVVFEAFGPDRIMFGSDWPVCLLAASYDAVVGVVQQYVAGFPAGQRLAVMGGNAERCYRLQERH